MGFSINKEGRVKGVDCFGECKRWNLEEENFKRKDGTISVYCRQCSTARFNKFKEGQDKARTKRAERAIKGLHFIKGLDKCNTDLERLICLAKEAGAIEFKMTYKGWMGQTARRLHQKIQPELDLITQAVKAQMNVQ